MKHYQDYCLYVTRPHSVNAWRRKAGVVGRIRYGMWYLCTTDTHVALRETSQ